MKRMIALILVLLLAGCVTPTHPARPAVHSVKPQGPVDSPQQAIETATGGTSDGKWDAVFVKGYVHPAKDETQSRDTWIVQRLHPGPHETIYVDALTGERYMVRQTEAPAPVALPKTEQGAVDSVFQLWGNEADIEPFPRAIGTKEGHLAVGGPAPGAKLPATFTTGASAAGQGSYDVTLTRRWQLNTKDFQTTWAFKVQPDGIVINAPKTGDELLLIK